MDDTTSCISLNRRPTRVVVIERASENRTQSVRGDATVQVRGVPCHWRAREPSGPGKVSTRKCDFFNGSKPVREVDGPRGGLLRETVLIRAIITPGSPSRALAGRTQDRVGQRPLNGGFCGVEVRRAAARPRSAARLAQLSGRRQHLTDVEAAQGHRVGGASFLLHQRRNRCLRQR